MARESVRKKRGFTVVELIVALSLSAATLLSGYELFEALKRAGDTQSADLATTAEIAHGLDQIREDLWHAVPRAGSRDPIFTGSSPDPKASADTTKLLEFYALCPGPGESRFPSLRQMYKVAYELAKTQDAACLYRRASPVVGPGPVSSDGGRTLVLERVEQIEAAFGDGRSSQPSFSSKERLPVCVGLTVTAYGQAWPLSVKLPCGTPEAQP